LQIFFTDITCSLHVTLKKHKEAITIKTSLLLDHTSITEQRPASQSTCYFKMKCVWGNGLSIICHVSKSECLLCLAPISPRWITFISACHGQWGKFIEHVTLSSRQGWHHHRAGNRCDS